VNTVDIHSTPQELDSLLADLRSEDAGRRQAAAETIAEQKLGSADIVQALKAITRADHFLVRMAAERALAAIADQEPFEVVNLPTPLTASAASTSSPPAKPAQKQSGAEKTAEFAMGFIGQLVIWGLGMAVLSAINGNIGMVLFGLLNLALLVWALLARRPWIALGMVACYAVAFLAVVIIGTLLLVACSGGLRNL